MASDSTGGTKSKVLLERMASIEAERQEHMKRQEEKDRLFKEAMASIETQSAKDTHSIKNTTKTLKRNIKFSGKREVESLKKERQREVERDTASNEFKERLASTFAGLEVNSRAHELDEWCNECGCIHESDVVNGGHEAEAEGGQRPQNHEPTEES